MKEPDFYSEYNNILPSETSSGIRYEKYARLNREEKILLAWCSEHLDGQITVLAESTEEGIVMADVLCGEQFIEFKTTSGNLTTLDTLLRRAAKQSHGHCVIVNMRNVSYSIEEATAIASRRMKRSGLKHVYLLQNNVLATHLFLDEKGEIKP